MTDNKDPQITEEALPEFPWNLWSEHKRDYTLWSADKVPICQINTAVLETDEQIKAKAKYVVEACNNYKQQAAELKQLRAERAGLIAEIDKEIIKLEPRLYKTDSEIEILYKFKKLKSKLTDSAQSGEGE